MSRLLELARTAATRVRDSAAATPSDATEGLTPAPDRCEGFRRCGDLAEAIHRHCSRCGVCRAEEFTSSSPGQLCSSGWTLREQYRKTRALLFGTGYESGASPVTGDKWDVEPALFDRGVQ